MKIIADDKIPFLKGILEPYAQVVYLPGKQINHAIVKDADALLIRTRTRCDETLLKDSSLKFIATATIGYDHIDTEYCEKNHITWTNAPGCNSASVMQYIASVLSTLAIEKGFSLPEKTLGIIGVGNVGSKVRKLALSLGMKVLLNDPPRAGNEGTAGFVSLQEVVDQSDIITLHVPLNKEGNDKTYHLFDERIIGKMKHGAWLINTSRGEVVETKALKQALTDQRLSGAILDVWEHEPDLDMELLDKVYLGTPHIAGYSADGKANGTSMSVQSLSRFFGLPLMEWYPADVPLPAESHFSLDVKGKTVEQIAIEAIQHTYRVREDHTRFKMTHGEFEKQRGAYPLRREFPAYIIKLEMNHKEIYQVLTNLGFKVNL